MNFPMKPLKNGRDLVNSETYHPASLLDQLLERLNLRNDAALCRLLEVAAPLLSKVRCRKISVSPALLLRIHDVTDIPVAELRAMMASPAATAAMPAAATMRPINTTEMGA